MAKNSIFDNIIFDNEADDFNQIRIIQVGPFNNDEIDPLGTSAELSRPSFYNLNQVVFAEPVHIDQNTESNDEDSFFDGTKSDDSSKSKHKIKEENEGDLLVPCKKKTDIKLTVKRKKTRRGKTDSVNNIGPCLCSEAGCGREFANAKRLREHIRKVHCSDGSRYPCSKCDKTFPLRYLLVRHQIVHERAKRQCPVCLKMLSLRNSLTLHMRSHAGLKPFTCLTCGKSFTRQAGLNAHCRFVHPSEGSLACKQCGVSFPRRADLTRHQLTEHVPPRQLECSSCGCRFSNRAALGAHRAKRHEAYDASLDKLWQSNKEDTKQEMSTLISKEITKTKPAKHDFGDRESIGNENRRVKAIPISVVNEEDKNMKLNEDGSEVCESCGAVLPTRSALIYHMSTHLPPSGGAHCQLCSTWQEQARAHYDAWHAPGARRTAVHRCNVCAKGFTRNCLLVRHMAVHTGSKPYQCHACSRGFACGSKLRVHLQTAHGQDPAPDSNVRPAALVAREMHEGLADGSKAVVRHEGKVVGFKTLIPRSLEDGNGILSGIQTKLKVKSKLKKKKKRHKTRDIVNVEPFELDVKPILANITIIPAMDKMEVVEGSVLKVVSSGNDVENALEANYESERREKSDVKKKYKI